MSIYFFCLPSFVRDARVNGSPFSIASAILLYFPICLWYDSVMKTNTVICSDNLPVLQSMPDASVDLVYMDPPFNTGRSWAGGVGGYFDKFKGAASILAGFEWIESAFDDASISYCYFMAHRLLEIHRVLKPTGHLFLHCDWRESAHLQVICNFIFSKVHFKNEIIWMYPKSYSADQYSSNPQYFPIAHNSILWWEKSSIAPFNPLYLPFTKKQLKEIFHHKDTSNRRFRTDTGRGRTRLYADEADGIPMTDVWSLNVAYPSERVGYPTQKPLALLNRIVKCGSMVDGLVLDPFCGCGTALLAARNSGRRYIGIDDNAEAVEWSRRRLNSKES